MRRIIGFFAVGILMILVLTANIFATSLEDLENQKDDIRQEINQGRAELNEKEKALEELNEKLTGINNELRAVTLELEGLQSQAEDKEKEIEETQERLDQNLLEQEKYKAQAIERLKVMYEYGDSGYIDVLIEADNIIDFLTRLEYLNKILEYDNEMFEKMAQIQRDIETDKEKLEVEKANIEHLLAETDIKKRELEDIEKEQNALMSKIENDKELLQAQLKKWEAAEAEIQQRIIRKLQESTLVYSGDKFCWPVKNHYRISSEFGTRIHPIYGYAETHTGIDIPSSYGNDIYAAANGVVIDSRWSDSYGNLIIVDHGSGYATLYGHNSKRLVAEGDTVVKGQKIALAGSTGWSTGNHLHFGVQVNGKWVNPMNYFE